MTIRTVPEARPATPPARSTRAHPADTRRRVLLFDGNDESVATAAPALAGLDIEVVRANRKAGRFEPTPRDVLVVVASGPGRSTRATTDLVRHIRSLSMLPVLVLAPRTEDDVLLQELLPTARSASAGLVPFELAQQIRAILRRAPSRVLRFPPLEIDMACHEVRVGEQAIELSPREFDLIAFLASSPGQAFTRRELLQSVWRSGREWQTPSTVTEHVRRLRVKLRAQPDSPQWLVTVRGTGYRFQP
jgi:DNA-binding response OmpR family regulator